MTDAVRSPDQPRFISGFGVQVLAGMVLGLVLGLAARGMGDGNWPAEALNTIGVLFVQLLKALVPPLVFTAIVASIANLKQLQNAGRLVAQTLLWFAITALIAVTIGILLGVLLQPGVRSGVDAAAAAAPREVGSWLDFLKGLVPSNYLGLAATTTVEKGAPVTKLSFNVLQIVIISIVVGVAALRSGEAGVPFLGFVQSALVVVRKILWWVIRLTPIGTLGLFGHAIAEYGWDSLARLGWFAGAVYLGLGLVIFGVYPALLLLNGLDPARFFRTVWPATQLGFVTRSSIGTMPVTEAVTENGLGVPRTYAAFAIPLAATTKMDGCAAIYPAIAALFVAQFYNLPLGVTDYLLIVFASVVGSAATAGLTGAVVMLTLTLSTLGLPLEGAGLLLAIDPILDMGRTAVNVTGQALVATIVAKRAGILDEVVYRGAGGDVVSVA